MIAARPGPAGSDRWSSSAFGPSSRSQSRRLLPKIIGSGAQGLLEDQAMLGFGTAAVLGGPFFQGFDDIERDVVHE
jgi:hypothetical protein